MGLLMGSGLLPMFGASSVLFTLLDEFHTNRAAGAISGTDAEPLGTTRTATDTESKATIDDGDLVFSGGKASPSFGDPGFWEDQAITRSAGKILIFRFIVSTGSWMAGLSSAKSGTIDIGAFANGTQLRLYPGISAGIYTLLTGVDYELILVLRTGGNDVYLRGGDLTYPTLLFQVMTTTGTTMYAAIANHSMIGRWRYIAIPNVDPWLPAPIVSHGFTSVVSPSDGLGHAEGVATGLGAGGDGVTLTAQVGSWTTSTNKGKASALTGSIAILTADSGKTDVQVDVRVTRVTEAAGFILRYVDANNYIYAYLQNPSGTDQIVLRKKVAGVDTAVQSAQIITYSANANFRCIMRGTKLLMFYNNAIVGSEQTIADAALQTGTAHGIYTNSLNNLFDDLYIRSLGTANEYSYLTSLLRSQTTRYIFTVGDSKTAQSIATWVGQLCGLLDTPSVKYNEILPRLAVTGYTAATMKVYAAANLPSYAASPAPSYILINLGANDMASGVTEANYKADMIVTIDLLRAKWPGVPIYITKPGRSGYTTAANNMATWIDAIVATYPSGVFVGDDERVWLENGDNYASLTSDGLHPNAAGNVAEAAAKYAVLTA